MFRCKDALGGVYKLNNGNFIPLIGLGTWRNKSQETVDRAVRAALQEGYRLIDTAHMYKNEEYIGKALEKILPDVGLQREDIFITTKVPTVDQDCEQETRRLLQESLEKLRVNYLDMVLVHYPRDRYTGKDLDHETNKRGRKTVWRVLEEYYDKVIMDNIGVANFMNYHLTEMKEYAKVPPAINQIEFQPYLNQNLVRHQCKEMGIFVQSFSNLGSGCKELYEEKDLQEIAKKHGVSMETILYAFGRQVGGGIVPKSDKPERIHNNLHNVLKVELSNEDVEKLRNLDRNAQFTHKCDVYKCL